MRRVSIKTVGVDGRERRISLIISAPLHPSFTALETEFPPFTATRVNGQGVEIEISAVSDSLWLKAKYLCTWCRDSLTFHETISFVNSLKLNKEK